MDHGSVASRRHHTMPGTPPISRLLSELTPTLSKIDCICPACGEASAIPFLERNGLPFVRCPSCSCLYCRPRPAESELPLMYDRFPQLSNGREGQVADDREDGRWEAEVRLTRLRELVDAGRVLDLGCGRGDFLVAASRAFEPIGVDIVPRIRPEAKGFQVFRGTLEAAHFPEASFEAVTAVEVLEHLFAPRRTMIEIHRILKPKGVFLFQTGDADSLRARLNPRTWTYLQPPIHLNVFSRESLVRLATELRFTPARAWSFGRAPSKMPIVLRIWKTAPFRRVWDLLARGGLLGEMQAWRKPG